jgi:hypothetical protein
VRLRVEDAVQHPVQVVHGDRPGDPVAGGVRARLRQLGLEALRLHVAVAGVRLRHVQGEELDR